MVITSHVMRAFDEAGNIGMGSKEFLKNWMDRYVAWVKQHAPLISKISIR